MNFKMIPCFVNVAVVNPDTYDGIYTDPHYAKMDRMDGFTTVPGYVLPKEFVDSLESKLGRIQAMTEQIEAERKAVNDALSRALAAADALEQQNQEMHDVLTLCLEKGSLPDDLWQQVHSTLGE